MTHQDQRADAGTSAGGGKALRIRQTLVLQDHEGHELFKIQERLMRLKRTMEVEDVSGHQVATVEKALVTVLRERLIVKIKGGPDLDVQGDVLHHEYVMGAGSAKIATVSKEWFRVRDVYGVEIWPGQDDGAYSRRDHLYRPDGPRETLTVRCPSSRLRVAKMQACRFEPAQTQTLQAVKIQLPAGRPLQA